MLLELPPSTAAAESPRPTENRVPAEPPRFQLIASADGHVRRHWTTFSVAVLAHAALVAAIVIVPLLAEDSLLPNSNIRAFFVAPPTVAPAPPPPPPPAPAAAPAAARRVAAPTPPPVVRDNVLRAPIEVPEDVKPEEPALDIGGIEGGVPGGVEGGVPGGVAGGIVGGTLESLATPPPPVVRIGGNIKAPKIIHRVDPAYPALARQTRITGAVVVLAIVDRNGAVREARALEGPPVLSEAAVDAVRQWRYQPLLLNGEPFAFELRVTVRFGLVSQTP